MSLKFTPETLLQQFRMSATIYH